MKVTNKTRFITQDLRLITREVLSKIYKTNLSFDRVDFISNNKRRVIDVICINYSDSNITVGIPRALQKNAGNAETVNRLMSYMYYYFFFRAWGQRPHSTISWGKYELRLKSSKANRPVVLVREEKAIKRVEQLKIKLAALEKKKASLLKALKKAEAKVKYYDKRSSKTAQEDDFKKRLQIKVQQLENQAL